MNIHRLTILFVAESIGPVGYRDTSLSSLRCMDSSAAAIFSKVFLTRSAERRADGLWCQHSWISFHIETIVG